MVRSESLKLLALTLAVVVLFGSGFTFGAFQDAERSSISLGTDSEFGAGNTVTNDVLASAGNTDSGGNSDGSCGVGNSDQDCTMKLLSGVVETPAAAEPRYHRP